MEEYVNNERKFHRTVPCNKAYHIPHLKIANIAIEATKNRLSGCRFSGYMLNLAACFKMRRLKSI